MNKSRHYYAPSMMVLAIGMAGCTMTKHAPTTADTEAFAARVIADKSSVAADAQQSYAALAAEDKALQGRKQAGLDTDEISVDYIGKPQQLIQTFAHRYGYRYVEEGRVIELRTINVRVTNAVPIDVLRNIGRQIDNGADVELDKTTKVVRLIFKPIHSK